MDKTIADIDVEKDIADYIETTNQLPSFKASTLTNEQLVAVLLFLTDEVHRLNRKVWNLIKYVREKEQPNQEKG